MMVRYAAAHLTNPVSHMTQRTVQAQRVNCPERAKLVAFLIVFGLAACSPLETQPPAAAAENSPATEGSDSLLDSIDAPATPSDEPAEDSLPLDSEIPAADETADLEANCTFEWVTGVAEVIEWQQDKVQLLFYPGEIRISVDRESLTAFISEGQTEIKSRLQKPLNDQCGNPAISFSTSIEP